MGAGAGRTHRRGDAGDAAREDPWITHVRASVTGPSSEAAAAILAAVPRRRRCALATRGERRRGPRVLVLGLVLGLVPACGGEEADDAGAGAVGEAAREADAPLPAGARPGAAAIDVASLAEDPSPRALLAALAQDHRRARRALGRHRITVEADFSLEPPPDLPRAQEGEARPTPQRVHDALSLTWAGEDDRRPAIHLRQGPDAADPTSSREIIVIGEDAYARLPHRAWLRRPLDAELHWRWLDDAERSVHDLVAFAAPSLTVKVTADDASSLTLALGAHEGADADLIAAGAPAAWRQGATLRSIAGEVVLDRASGLWQRAALRVEYSVVDGEGRTLTGVADLKGERVVDEALTVEAPAKSAPSPERIRYEDERRRLLGGLGR